MTLSEELTWRGFTNQTTFKDIKVLDRDPIRFYWGVDPSAPSMTIGNLAAAMMVRHFISHGHQATLLVGGATGMIGDPDGKSEERTLKELDEVNVNKAAIIEQYGRIFEGQNFEVVDNYDWFKGINYLDFLRSVGKHVPMRQMLGRDFVGTRLGEDGAGISYAEFSYVLIQAYDFLHLSEEKGVSLQVCGSDQWGNSIAGVDLIRRKTGKEAHVWSTPLVINKATGKKFGKTEDGAVWLDETLTSAYQYYQFWLNVDDEGVESYLKIYTELSKEEIDLLVAEFSADRASRKAQKALAYESTKIVHGQEKAEAARNVSEVLFGEKKFLDLQPSEQDMLARELKVVTQNDDLHDLLVTAGLAGSKSEARTFIDSGAISINGEKITARDDTLFSPGMNLIKRGKNNFAIVIKN